MFSHSLGHEWLPFWVYLQVNLLVNLTILVLLGSVFLKLGVEWRRGQPQVQAPPLWDRSLGHLSLLLTVCQASSQQQRGENLSHKALSYKLLLKFSCQWQHAKEQLVPWGKAGSSPFRNSSVDHPQKPFFLQLPWRAWTKNKEIV